MVFPKSVEFGTIYPMHEDWNQGNSVVRTLLKTPIYYYKDDFHTNTLYLDAESYLARVLSLGLNLEYRDDMVKWLDPPILKKVNGNFSWFYLATLNGNKDLLEQTIENFYDLLNMIWFLTI